MSYDLYFLRPAGAPAPDPAEVLAWFRSRPHYQLDDAGGEARYANEHTGVYFTFRAGAEAEEAEPAEDGLLPTDLSFEINYARPHVFGLEAAPELAAFVERFGLLVDDPQNEGMDRGPFGEEGFLRGWNAGNRFGYQVVFGRGDAGDPNAVVLPQAEIRRIWAWNLGVPALRERLGPDVYVPHVMVALLGGRPTTLVGWPDAIPIAMPRVETLVLQRDELAPRRLLGLLPGRAETLVADAAALGAWATQTPERPEGYRLLGEAGTRDAAVRFFRARPSMTPAFTILPLDQVLDAETAAQARGGR